MTGPRVTAGLPVATWGETRRELWRTSRGRRGRILAVGLVGLLSAGLGLALPVALGGLINAVDDGTADAGTVWWTIVVMVGATTAGAAGTALTAVLAGRIYQSMLAELRERLVATAMRLPQGVVERSGTGDLVARASDDVAQIADAAHRVVPALTSASFTIIVSFAGMAALDWRYGLALATTLPVYVLALRWYLATAPQVYQAQRAAAGGRAQQILESLRGFETVQAFGLGRRRHRRVIGASWTVVRHTLRARTVQNMFVGRLHAAEYLGLSAILVTGCLLIGAGLSTVGAATTAMLLFLRLFGPITQLLLVIDVLQSALASLNRMVGVITLPVAPSPAAGDRDGAPAAPPGTPVARLRGVGFGYPGGRRVLHDVDLTIGPGERVAVVGASGAGKTTLAGLLAGIHSPDGGTVTRPANTMMITQDAHVFAGTLRDNLTLAAPDATDSEIGEALAATGAADLLELLPDGLDTVLGAAGRPVTAARAQQIALTRVLLADPELAIFDEATAEAGSGYAELLDRSADAALRGRAGLVIAHRLSQAAACDRIVVLADGRVIESGSHSRLAAAYGLRHRAPAAGRRRGRGPAAPRLTTTPARTPAAAAPAGTALDSTRARRPAPGDVGPAAAARRAAAAGPAQHALARRRRRARPAGVRAARRLAGRPRVHRRARRRAVPGCAAPRARRHRRCDRARRRRRTPRAQRGPHPRPVPADPGPGRPGLRGRGRRSVLVAGVVGRRGVPATGRRGPRARAAVRAPRLRPALLRRLAQRHPSLVLHGAVRQPGQGLPAPRPALRRRARLTHPGVARPETSWHAPG